MVTAHEGRATSVIEIKLHTNTYKKKIGRLHCKKAAASIGNINVADANVIHAWHRRFIAFDFPAQTGELTPRSSSSCPYFGRHVSLAQRCAVHDVAVAAAEAAVAPRSVADPPELGSVRRPPEPKRSG